MFNFFGLFNSKSEDEMLGNYKGKLARDREVFAKECKNNPIQELETARETYEQATELLEKAKARYENFHKVNDLLSQERFKQLAQKLTQAYCALVEGEKAYLNHVTIEILRENVEKVLEEFTNEVFKNPTPIDEFDF